MNPAGKHCVYQKHESGIREFIFLDKTSLAVDEWITHLDTIMLVDPPRNNVKELLLLDIRQSIPAIVYAAQQLHAWRQRNPQNDDNTRAALLLDTQSKLFLNVANDMVRIVKLEKVDFRFFYRNRQKAIDWLLAQK